MNADMTKYDCRVGGFLDFIRGLWNQPLATSDDITTLETPGLYKTNSRLFIFSEYGRTTDWVNKVRATYRGGPGAVVVVGLPGIGKQVIISGSDNNICIGKSCWLQYMASLEARAGRPFLFYRRNVYYLVREDGVYAVGDFHHPLGGFVQTLETDRAFIDTVLFVDVDTGDVPSILPDVFPFIIQAASPQHSHYKWLKQHPEGRMFVMNPHPAHELQAA